MTHARRSPLRFTARFATTFGATLATTLAATAITTAPAAADPHKLLVLQADGRADAATRAKVDAALLRLARGAEPQAAPGELSLGDAATAVGCRPDTAACRDDVLSMLAVDELVSATLTPKPGGLEITVRRFTRGGGVRDATALVPSGTAADKVPALAALFGEQPAPPSEPSAPAGPAPVSRPPTGPSTVPSAGPSAGPGERSTATTPAPIAPATTSAAPPPYAPPPSTVRPTAPSPIVTAPPPFVDEGVNPRRRRLEIVGMAGGAGLAVLGVVLWGAARSVQSDINSAPTTTAKDLANLRDLEKRGDGYAGVGNLFVVSGLVVGGVATYYFLKDRRAASAASVARLTPAVLDGGAGLVLTIGGAP